MQIPFFTLWILAAAAQDVQLDFESRPSTVAADAAWRTTTGARGRGLALTAPAPLPLGVDVPDRGFTLSAWVRTDFVLDTSITLIAGAGWSIDVGEDGAWKFLASDGKTTLDYTPTPARQSIVGSWHKLAVRIDAGRTEARLAFDGSTVAILDLSTLEGAPSSSPMTFGGQAIAEGEYAARIDDLSFERRLATDAEIAAHYARAYAEASKSDPDLAANREWLADDEEGAAEAPEELRVLAWNIWHGGREDGEQEGVWRTIETIRNSGADVVCMQETYGSGPRIADELGFYVYLRSSNLSIMSRYPIGETYQGFEPFKLGGARIQVSPDVEVNVFCLWIHYLPDWWGVGIPEKATPEALIAGETGTRVADIEGVLKALAPHLATTDETPLILAGDFNSESHLDWTAAAADRHGGLVVEWPVSKALTDAGLVDAYRAVHADPVAKPGTTWSPRFTDQLPGRIDYVYSKGALVPRAAEVLDQHYIRWPSDHAAVLVRFDWTR